MTHSKTDKINMLTKSLHQMDLNRSYNNIFFLRSSNQKCVMFSHTVWLVNREEPPGRETPNRETPWQGEPPLAGRPPSRETPRQGELSPAYSQ